MDKKVKTDANKLLGFPPYVDIMGMPYLIEVKSSKEDRYFDEFNCSGYCESPTKMIRVLNDFEEPSKKWVSDEFAIRNMKRVLRHEIVHAFLNECGLSHDSASPSGGWAKNEEMVDWFARIGQRIYKAWEEAHCLDYMSIDAYIKWKASKKDE